VKIGRYNRNGWVFDKLTPELAYLIGVYLGDGCIDSTNRFRLKVIDKDFVEYTAKCILDVCGDILPVMETDENYTYKGKTKLVHNYYLQYSKNDFVNWLRSLSDKETVPSIIPRTATLETKKFLEGLMDSEGWISMSRQIKFEKGTHRWGIGIAATSGWIRESKDLFQKFGIRIHKEQTGVSRSGKILYSYGFNPCSFAYSGLKFNISRKQERLELYKKEMQIDPLRDCAPCGRHRFSPSNDTVRSL